MTMPSFLQGVSLELLLAAAAGMICVIAIAAGIRSLMGRRDAVVERLERVGRADVQVFPDTIAARSPEPRGLAGWFTKMVKPLSRLARPTNTEELSRARLNLVRAGFRGEYALETFLGIKLFVAPIVTIAFLQMNAMLPNPMAMPVEIAGAVWLCAVAFWAPNLVVRSRRNERQASIEKALPDAMDLLVTCVEAGLGLDAALARVSDELQLAAPLLADELNQTFLEIQAGIPRADAFRRLAERTGVDDLKSLAAMLIQTDIFGTSVARALRVHSDGMRIRRMQRAEERAAMVSVKMTIPLVLFILPSLIAIVMGPAVIMIMKAFSKQ